MYMAAAMYETMGLLAMTEEEYLQYKYDMGIVYLREYLRGDEDAIAAVSGHKAFWSWWRYNWYLREREWLAEYNRTYLQYKHDAAPMELMVGNSRMLNQHGRSVEYNIIHNPGALANGNTEWGKLLEASYAQELVPMLNSCKS